MDFVLGPKAEAASYRLEQQETAVSTNALALARARGGAPGRLWIVSDHQSGGRGRRGNSWSTPRGNLAASLLLHVDTAPTVAATLGFVAGLALDEALRQMAPALALPVLSDSPGRRGAEARLRLKWPNDVLLDGGKLAGILLEAEPVAEGRLAVVIGIGVNVVATPSGLPYPAAALHDVAIASDARQLFSALSDTWAGLERIWENGKGFPRIRDLWLDRAAGLGEEIVARIGEERVSGIFEAIDEEGRLVLGLAGGTVRTVTAGEVHLRIAGRGA